MLLAYVYAYMAPLIADDVYQFMKSSWRYVPVFVMLLWVIIGFVMNTSGTSLDKKPVVFFFACLNALIFAQGQEFLMEIVMISSHKHNDLVSLVGSSDESDKKIVFTSTRFIEASISTCSPRISFSHGTNGFICDADRDRV